MIFKLHYLFFHLVLTVVWKSSEISDRSSHSFYKMATITQEIVETRLSASCKVRVVSRKIEKRLQYSHFIFKVDHK